MIYLKLQAKLLLPASVIQTVVEEVQETRVSLFSKLKEKLSVLEVPDMTITNVIEELTKDDILKKKTTAFYVQINVVSQCLKTVC